RIRDLAFHRGEKKIVVTFPRKQKKRPASAFRRLNIWTAVGAAFSLALAGLSQAQVNVTTYHFDNTRTGQNTQESVLTPFNVNSGQFGKLFTTSVDGWVYAQPLYLSSVPIAGGTHDVVYVATEHDSVYAINSDNGGIYWKVGLIPSGGTTVNSNSDLFCGDLVPEVGITGTPVIDTTTGTLYVVAKSKVGGGIVQYLHAIDVVSGQEKFGGPVKIQASVRGSASDGNGTTVVFSAHAEHQRAGLLLENGHVVIAWAGHCDRSPWHGWIMSYSASSLVQEAVFNTSADGSGNGVWMSGGGVAADADGNIFFATGNGSWNGTTDFGDSLVKLGPPSGGKFSNVDYFTPYNQDSLSTSDSDLASGGVMLLPKLASGKQYLAGMGKEGKLYLVDTSNMGGYCIKQSPPCSGSDPQIVQEIHETGGIWGTPAYWNGHAYWGGGNDGGSAESLKAFSFNANGSGRMSSSTSQSAEQFSFSGLVPAVSSSGNTNGIVWGIKDPRSCSGGTKCQALYAYDATNLGNLLYTSAQAANSRDAPGGAVKFVTPIIANGKVYVGSQFAVSGYGLLGTAPTPTAMPTFSPAGGSYTSTQTVTLADATAGATIYYTTDGSAPTTSSAAYSGPLAISTTTTVKAFAVASGHPDSAVASSTYTIGATGGSTVPVDLSGADNVFGIAQDGSVPQNGGLDTHGDALSANLIGSSITWSGVNFPIGNAGAADAISNTTLVLPAGKFSTLKLLGLGINGSQPNQSFVVTYTDGTTTTVTQSISDWLQSQNYSGETKVLSMAYAVSPTGGQSTGPQAVYGYSFAIDNTKTVKTLTLPNNRNVVVLSVVLLSGSSAPPPTSVSFSAPNVSAIWKDGVPPGNGGLIGSGYAISANVVGTSVTWAGVTFTLGAPDAPDAVSKTTVALPAGNFAAMKILAVAGYGNHANQPFVVTYTDGSTKTFTQSVSDWFVPNNNPGETKVLSMPYCVLPNGGKRIGPQTLYGYSFAIDKTKTVKSLKLPTERLVVVLAITLTP
ncbi:MAG: chitobiase/beta-hexosaminidase C-terminal domain-containing protein, partial [Pseudomonadota bacterium]|nr:chitobiase/beta-hexosaminidase C-terminal domain-containing protein [Pseudomonadota bacterium]